MKAIRSDMESKQCHRRELEARKPPIQVVSHGGVRRSRPEFEQGEVFLEHDRQVSPRLGEGASDRPHISGGRQDWIAERTDRHCSDDRYTTWKY